MGRKLSEITKQKNRIRAKKWRKDNYERYKLLKKKSREKTKSHIIYNKKYKKNRKIANAHLLAERHIKIPQNQICEICKIHLAKVRHHDDYSKPLEVKFVCKKCNNNLRV